MSDTNYTEKPLSVDSGKYDYQSLPPKRSRTVQAAYTFKPRSNRPRRIGDILKPFAKKIIITAYCNGHLSKERTQELFRELGLGDC